MTKACSDSLVDSMLPTIGHVAQLVEQRIDNAKVTSLVQVVHATSEFNEGYGSSPVMAT